MRLNKKSIMLFGIMIGLILGFCLFLLNYAKLDREIKSGIASQSKYIGDIEISSIQAYQGGEKLLLYIDQAAKYSAGKAMDELALSWGNINERSKCGEYEGYVLYQAFNKTTGEIKDCFPDRGDVEQRFTDSFNGNFNDYLRAYYIKEQPLDNYIYSLKPTANGLDLLGIAVRNANYSVQPKEEIDESVFFKAVQDLADKNSFFWSPGGRISTPSGNFVSIRSGYVGLCDGTCMLRQGAAEMLKDAEKLAEAAGYRLYVYESWRSEDYQRELWDKYGHDPALVCGPDASGSFSKCSHNQGIAVDIAFVGLPMTASNYQELEKIMCRAGWVRYIKEPWHFEIGTDRYEKAKAAGVCAA